MDIVIFGTGLACKKSLPYLKQQHNIKAVVDNNEKLWGTYCESYLIESPSKVIDGKTDIVITSEKYSIEIVNQLINMGVSQNKIQICYKYGLTYPIDADNLHSADVPLIKYDLLNNEDKSTNKIKVMIYCTFFSTYTKQLIENMSKRIDDVEISLLTAAPESVERIHADILKHIYCYETMEELKSILENIPIYDVMQLLRIEKEWVYFVDLIRSKAKKLNLKVGGSDFYRANNAEREYKRKLIGYVDLITADTQSSAHDFASYFKKDVEGKMFILPYGVEVLDYINRDRDFPKEKIRRKFNINLDKIIVTCGTNAGKAHQHLKIVEALVKLPLEIKEQIVCIFPMTYGERDLEYEDEIIAKLNETGIECVILKDFMDFNDMAQYALISDIMIHVQTTDQLSSTMLEEMYAGSIIIAGKWLPYKVLQDEGIYFLDVDEIPEVTEVLTDVVNHIDEYKEKCKANREIVWKRASWDNLAGKWNEIWKVEK